MYKLHPLPSVPTRIIWGLLTKLAPSDLILSIYLLTPSDYTVQLLREDATSPNGTYSRYILLTITTKLYLFTFT